MHAWKIAYKICLETITDNYISLNKLHELFLGGINTRISDASQVLPQKLSNSLKN